MPFMAIHIPGLLLDFLANRPDDSSLSFFDELQDSSSLRSNVDIVDMTFDVDKTMSHNDFNNDNFFVLGDANYSLFTPKHYLHKP